MRYSGTLLCFFFLLQFGTAYAVTPTSHHVSNQVIALEIDKKTLEAHLRTWPEDHSKSRLVAIFKVAIGKAQGDKQVEGDNKTPEGIYFAQREFAGVKLPKKYGATAIPIDFPNPVDLLDKKTGHGIWLHGVESDDRVKEANVTEGCVAFHNKDILSLTNWLRPHHGYIIIADGLGDVNVDSDLRSLKKQAYKWIKAWQSRDIDGYISHYAKDFKFKRKNLKSNKRYKKQVFRSYRRMDVKVSNLRAFSHPKYAMTIMNQDFNGDNRYFSVGRKILYWKRDKNRQWKIIHEVFEKRRVEGVSVSLDSINVQNPQTNL